jgi:selenocysteine lyase/cysteine desulfurase
MVAKFPDLDPAYRDRPGVSELIAILSSGGDARITLDPASGLNRYLAAPYPRRTLAFASSTANDISAPAFDHLLGLGSEGLKPYSAHLADLRQRIIAAYGITAPAEVVFAPSGTDLEFVALAAVAGRGRAGVHNILLGADEVGSGCIYSARGEYFAGETALGVTTQPGEPVAGMESVTLVDVPVRCPAGIARSSEEIADQVRAEILRARGEGRHALLHVVHGSKTGLILPKLREIDALQAEFGDGLSLVVDACQARIARGAVRAYLDRGAIVFLTGSKFMGGPPFSGFALVPEAIIARAAPLPSGFVRLFRRAEWGEGWAGRERLEDSPNPGLALRLEASVFELERFSALDIAAVERVILAFQRAVRELLEQRLGFRCVEPFAPGAEALAADHPIEMLTLATLDVSRHPEAQTFEAARGLYQRLDKAGLRLGQPVKCVRREDGEWGGTLRVGLSMPQVCALAAIDKDACEAELFQRIDRFAGALATPA